MIKFNLVRSLARSSVPIEFRRLRLADDVCTCPGIDVAKCHALESTRKRMSHRKNCKRCIIYASRAWNVFEKRIWEIL